MVAAQPDVILMDINLPGMSGIECVARLRKDLLGSACHHADGL
jgi:CheY-like chemotaxis protein